jgi:hypothetical protein
VELLYSKYLILYYPFDKSGNDIVDESSNKSKNTGIIKPIGSSVNITNINPPGIKHASIQIDNYSIRIPSLSFDNGGSFSGLTVAFSFVIDNNYAGCIFDFTDRDETKDVYDNIAVYIAEGHMHFFCVNGIGNVSYLIFPLTDLNKWGHYVFTISTNGSMTAYKNGNIIVPSHTATKRVIPDTKERTQSLIGKSSDVFGNLSLKNGKISDFRVYNTEWKAENILNYWNYVSFKLKVNMSNFILNFRLDGKEISNITNDNNGILIWKDALWNGKTNAIASNTSVVYQATSQKVTIPAGSYLDIPNNNNNFGAPFTIFLVVNVHNFKPTVQNVIIGSKEMGAFEFIFYNNQVMVNLVYTATGTAPVKIPSIPEIDPTIPHVITVSCSKKGEMSVYIDSRTIIKNQKFNPHRIPANHSIQLGGSLGNQYPSSNELDFYEIIHCRNYFQSYVRNMIEAHLARKWNLQIQLDDSNVFKNVKM